MLMKLRHRFNKYIKHPAQRVRAFSSKLWRYFGEHIDNYLFKYLLLLVFLLGALGVAVAVEVPENIVSCLQELLGLSEQGKYAVLKAIGFCVVGVLLVLQALAANKRAKAMEDTTENTEAGQRQERLKNAIEHLGRKSDSVRMGGAYELFHLAKDTEDEDLRQTVMDILCAHIRQTTRGKGYQAEYKSKPSEEIQSLLTLLFVQEHDVFEGCSINLQGGYLNGATLSQARLEYANLKQAQFQEADLFDAQLQDDFLIEAVSQGAILSKEQQEYFLEIEMQREMEKEMQLQEDKRREAKLQAQLQETYLSNNAASAPDSDKGKED